MFRSTLKFPARTFGLRLNPLSRSGVVRSITTSADLKVDLTAPNGRQFTLPTGLFINNEFVKSSSGSRVTSVNPA